MLRAVGTEVLGRMVDHLLRQTRKVADLVRSHSGFELLAPPRLSTLLFRYVGPAAGGDMDAFNRRLRAHLLTSGQAVLGETTIAGRAALKLTLLNPCLRMEDFDRLLSVITDAAERLD